MSLLNNEMLGGLGGLFGGLFGHSDSPYNDAMKQYQEWTERARKNNQPYIDAGHEAIPKYQEWLDSQKDPSGFINNLMGGYEESPWAHYMQQQAQNAATNAGSASGLIGSSPMMQQVQQNASNISSQDMQAWLHNVLGINTQYGQGQSNMMNLGQNTGNNMNQMYDNMGQRMGDASFGANAGRRNDLWNTIGGGLSLLNGFL